MKPHIVPEDHAFARARKDVLQYSPPQWMEQYTGLRKINVILIGEAQAGKTAFVSTIASICLNRIKKYGEESSGPTWLKRLFMPKNYKSYELTTAEGRETAFRIFDTVGLGVGGPDYEQLRNFIAGIPPTSGNPMLRMLAVKRNSHCVPKLEDKMHSIVFVVPAPGVQNERHMGQIKNLMNIVFLLDMQPIVLLTKIDKLYSSSSIGDVLESKVLCDLKQVISTKVGIPSSCIVPVKNIEGGSAISRDEAIVALKALKEILNTASSNYRMLSDGPTLHW